MSRLYLSNPCALSTGLLHTVLRAQSAPGFPCALCTRGTTKLQNSGKNGPRECTVLFPRHCERSEAIHLSFVGPISYLIGLRQRGRTIPRVRLNLQRPPEPICQPQRRLLRTEKANRPSD